MSSDFNQPEAGAAPAGNKFQELLAAVQKDENVDFDAAMNSEEEEKKIKKLEPFERKQEYTDDELLNFWNSMLQEEQYHKSYSVKSIEFTLRTRSSSEVDQINKYMDIAAPRFQSHYDIAYNKAALAFALVEVNGKKMPEGSLSARLKWLDSKPAPLMTILIQHLIEFDANITEMIEETSSENF